MFSRRLRTKTEHVGDLGRGCGSRGAELVDDFGSRGGGQLQRLAKRSPGGGGRSEVGRDGVARAHNVDFSAQWERGHMNRRAVRERPDDASFRQCHNAFQALEPAKQIY